MIRDNSDLSKPVKREKNKPRPCNYCKVPGHYPYQCSSNPYLKKYGWRGSKGYDNPKAIKSLKKRGKQYINWVRTRREWFINNPAESYICYLCGKYLLPNETTLDHVLPRSRNPELRYKFSNLKPCCYDCNIKKGSKVYN